MFIINREGSNPFENDVHLEMVVCSNFAGLSKRACVDEGTLKVFTTYMKLKGSCETLRYFVDIYLVDMHCNKNIICFTEVFGKDSYPIKFK